MTSYADTTGSSHGHAHGKLTKSRNRTAVKPILKKRVGPTAASGTQVNTSQSAKSSLDYDRGWEEQIHYGSHGWGAGTGASRNEGWADVYGGGDANRAARDVSFSLSATDLDSSGGGSDRAGGDTGGVGAVGVGVGRSKYSHARSTSGASHTSIATTASSSGGHRNGSFVHPFQQTPRTSTPPLSLAHSLNGGLDAPPGFRDYSPTITEDEDAEVDGRLSYSSFPGKQGDLAPSLSGQNDFTSFPHGNTTAAATATATTTTHPAASAAVAGHQRRPSLASNRTSSRSSDLNSQHALRINTNRSTSLSGGSRLAHVSSTSDINLPSESQDTPDTSSPSLSTSIPAVKSPVSPANNAVASPNSQSTMSPLRTSFEGFRLRSHSELDASYHNERIRQERQKWQDRQRLKDMKRERAELKRRDRDDTKQASRLEKEQAQLYKEAQALAKRESKESKEAARYHAGPALGDDDETGLEGNRETRAPRPVDAGSAKFSAPYMNNSYLPSPRSKHRHRDHPENTDEKAKARHERRKLQSRVPQNFGNIPSTGNDPATVEKLAFMGRGRDSADRQQDVAGAPGGAEAEAGTGPADNTTAAQGVNFNVPKRNNTAKRRAQGAWTTFVLWFRSRVLRLQTKLDYGS